MKKKILLLFSVITILTGCNDNYTIQNNTLESDNEVITSEFHYSDTQSEDKNENSQNNSEYKDLDFSIPKYSGQMCIEINNNITYFTSDQLTTEVFETYSELDKLGRCGVAFANICEETMPTEERGEIGFVKPSGWSYNGKSNNNKYDFVDGKYVYNRCHLIGYQLAGENANELNLITGTRSFNVIGMLEYENNVADYVKNTHEHVIYRVTPIYTDNNLLADGVLMEAKSVESDGLEFCVFVYNVEPGVKINYENGQNWLDEENIIKNNADNGMKNDKYVWITKTGSKYHSINNCGKTNSKNTEKISEKEAVERGYDKCTLCW